MSGPPPQDLMDWTKPQLVRELERIRAILRAHADRPHDPARSGGDAVSVSDDPYARGNVALDAREAVLLDYNEVILVDTEPGSGQIPRVALILAGRVNMTHRHVRQMYLLNTDAAAALVSQLAGLAGRAGGAFASKFKADLDRRMMELP